MQQSSDPQSNMLPLLPSAAPVAFHVGDDDRKEVLIAQGKDAICNASTRKKLLHRLTSQKSDILEKAKSLDAFFNTSIHRILSSKIKSKTQFTQMDKVDSANAVVGLFEICGLLSEKLREQMRGLRSDSQDVTMKLLVDIGELKEKVDKQVRANLQNTGSDPILKGKTLSNAQRERLFDINLLPDEAMQSCLFCGHESINKAKENEGMSASNKAKTEEEKKSQRVWDKYEKEKLETEKNSRALPQAPKNPTTGRAMKRRPHGVKLERPWLQCMCSTSYCAQQGTDIGSSCPIKCKCENGDRYPFQGGQCQCQVCQCECSKAYEIGDIQRIGLKLSIQANSQTNTAQSIPPEVQTANFMGNVFGSAMFAANDVYTAASKAKAKDPQGVSMDAFYDAAALNTIKKGEVLSFEARSAMRNQFGFSTIVALPGGKSFDTKTISRPSNFHAKNNRFNSQNDVGPATGMKNNLEIDYSDTFSSTFKQASMSGSSFASRMIAGLTPPTVPRASPPSGPRALSSGISRSAASAISISSTSSAGQKGVINIDGGAIICLDDTEYNEEEDRKMPAKRDTPCKQIHDRMLDRCRRDKVLSKDKSEMTKSEKQERKQARKRQKSILAEANKNGHRVYCREVAKTMGMHNDDVIEEALLNGAFDSQEASRLYMNGFMSDSDDDE